MQVFGSLPGSFPTLRLCDNVFGSLLRQRRKQTCPPCHGSESNDAQFAQNRSKSKIDSSSNVNQTGADAATARKGEPIFFVLFPKVATSQTDGAALAALAALAVLAVLAVLLPQSGYCLLSACFPFPYHTKPRVLVLAPGVIHRFYSSAY